MLKLRLAGVLAGSWVAAAWLAGCGAAVPVLPLVQVAPAVVTLQAGGGTQQFTVTVLNAPNGNVVWKVNGVLGGSPATGTITQAGLYSAPASIPAAGSVSVQAVSVANDNSVGTATVTLRQAVGITITPTTATVDAGQSLQFNASVTNATNTAVTWSVNGANGGSAALGTISASGVYTAPATFPGLNQVTVTATSQADPNEAASAVVALTQPVGVSVTPASSSLVLGASLTFTASVTGASNPAVTWSVNGIPGGSATLGTINAQGVFTAPNLLPSPAVESIIATSVADTTRSGSAKLTLAVPAAQFSFSPAQATLSLGKAASGQATFQVSASAGFNNPIQFTVSGLPVNVTASVSPASLTGSGAVNVTLSTASISLTQASVPVTLTGTSTDAQGNKLVQSATVSLSITGWAGHVRTVAGGPGGVGFEDGSGATDELQASALVSDGAHTLFFSDKRGTALRSFGLDNQTVTTLLGGPYNFTVAEGDGMAWDPSSNTVYIADALRNRVVAYTLGAGDLRVIAGGDIPGHADGIGAAASFDFPHGLALSPDHTTLYVADTNNELIRKIDVASQTVSTLAGQFHVFRSTDGVGPAATFCQPTGLAMDPAGTNIFITDQCGYVVRQLALPSAAVTTVAGTGQIGQADGAAASATFMALSGVLVDPHQDAHLLYVADGNEIRAVRLGANASVFTLAGQPSPGQSDGGAGSASFFSPTNFASLADATGPGTTSLFVADTDNGLLRRVDVANPLTMTAGSLSLKVTTIAGQPSHRGAADGPGTGADFSGASTATFSAPAGIVTDGKIAYVADSGNGAIRKIDLATSTVTTVAGPHQGFGDGAAGQAAFFQNAGLAWVPSQNVIYIADTGNAAIRKLDLTTQTVTTIAGTNASGYADGTFAQARFNHPFGILASPDGTKLYVADTGNNAIRLVDLTAGTVSTIAGNGGLGFLDGVGASARFAEPNGLAFDASGQNLFISDFENQAIRELNLASGQVTTIVGMARHCGKQDGPAAQASLCDPAFLTTDGRSLFWGDSNTGLLRVLNLTSMVVSTLAGQPGVLHMQDGDFTETPGELTGPVQYNGVFGLALAPDDSFVLFTDKTANVVRIIK